MAAPRATVVVVSRDRWSSAPSTLDCLLTRTDPRHPVVVVDGHAPRSVAAEFERLAVSGRIRVVRRGRFLAGNEARNIGADGARTEWVAFVENDVILSPGWLDVLLDEGEARGAASVHPVYLEPARNGPVVHGLGAELEVHGPIGMRHLREREHHLGRPWSEVSGDVVPVARAQSEPHALVIRRELLERMGGFDEKLLSWFDHTDLALRMQQFDATSWLVPQVTCLYLTPRPATFHDVPTFLLRWGEDWYERSLEHLCGVWGLDRHDAEWDKHARYRTVVRRRAFTQSPRVSAVVDRAVLPIERFVARRWQAQRAPA